MSTQVLLFLIDDQLTDNPNATYRDREAAAIAAAMGTVEAPGPCRRIMTAFGGTRLPWTDAPSDTLQTSVLSPNDMWLGRDGVSETPRSRGVAVEVITSSSRDETTVLTVGEKARLLPKAPADGDREWGNLPLNQGP